MAGATAFEMQLGHLCNNRCVFCISGRRTSEGRAPLLGLEALRAELDRAWRSGKRSVTFLGGEPTIQPFFVDLVRHAVALGFDPIVIFSNGSKPGRTDLVDEVLATGGRFEWRFSFQGATREAHERTTRRRGSFDQLLRAVARAHAHRQRITVNTCVVQQNFESLPHFAELLLPRGASQLHVDVVNPYDTGTDDEETIRAVQPRYSDLEGPLEQMVRAFPPGFDVNIGNLPYCIAPQLAAFVHHGGAPTWTVTADDFGSAKLGGGRNKYLVKAERKLKTEACRACVFDARCTGFFERYAEQYGLDELRPVTPEMQEDLRRSGRAIPSPHAEREPAATPSIDASIRRAPRLLQAAYARLRRAAPFGELSWTRVGLADDAHALELTLANGDERAVAWLRVEENRLRGGYRLERADASEAMRRGLGAFMRALRVSPESTVRDAK